MTTIGETVPDFTLPGATAEEIREFTLSEVAESRPVLLVFYVYDFSPVCSDQMCEVNDSEFLTFNDDAAVLGISPDGPYSHQRFIEENSISYPLLTDQWMDVYEEFEMVSQTESGRQHMRGIVLVDSDLTVRYRWMAEDNWDEWSMERLSEANSVIQGGLA